MSSAFRQELYLIKKNQLYSIYLDSTPCVPALSGHCELQRAAVLKALVQCWLKLQPCGVGVILLLPRLSTAYHLAGLVCRMLLQDVPCTNHHPSGLDTVKRSALLLLHQHLMGEYSASVGFRHIHNPTPKFGDRLE